MQKYNLVVENPESTVVSDYGAEHRTAKEYQSEAELDGHSLSCWRDWPIIITEKG